MKAAVVDGQGGIQVQAVPDLKIDAYQALVKMKACSICNGTDSKIVAGKLPFVQEYPGIIGHESVGEVIQVGEKVSKYKVGDLVFRPGAFYPEGAQLTSCWGGFAEYGIVSDGEEMLSAGLQVPGFASMQQVITQPIDPIDATILITYKEALSWLQKFKAGPGASMLIWGSGPVGLSFTFFAKLLGCYPVIVCGRRENTLQDALAMGADHVINTTKEDVHKTVRRLTNQQGVQKIIDAVGDFDLVSQSIPMLAPDGEIGIYGIASGDDKAGKPVIDPAMRYVPWGLKVMGPDEAGAHQQMMDLVRMGLVNASFMVDEVIDLKDISHGFSLIRQRKAKKVVVSFQ